MDSTLVDPLPATEPAGSSEPVRQFGREVLQPRQEGDERAREDAALRQQVGSGKAMHARAVHRAELLEAEIQQLRGEDRTLRDQLLGRTSERASSQDRSNRLEGEEDPAPPSPPERGQRKDSPGPTRRDDSHLPVVEGLRELPEQRRVCPRCGTAPTPSGTEDAEQIEIEVRAYRRPGSGGG